MSTTAAAQDRDRATSRLWPALPLAGFFALVGPAAVAGALALAPLQTLAALLSARGAGIWRGLKATWPVWLLALAFVGFAAASMLWSPFIAASVEQMQGAKLAAGVLSVGLLTAAAGASPRSAAMVRAAGVAAALVLVALLCIEAFGDMALNRLGQPTAETGVLERNPGRGVAVLVIVAFGAMGALVGGDVVERALSRVILIGALILSTQFNMSGNLIAMLVGFVAFLLAYQAPRFWVSALGLGLAVWVIIAPFVLTWLSGQHELSTHLPLSWQVRLDIWSYVGGRIGEAPLLGHGIDASRTITGLGQVGDLQFPQVPLHPHSAPLQVWFELGAVGAGLLAATLAGGGLLAGRTLRNQPAAAAAACGSLSALAVLWSISYGAWQEWLMALLGISLALANAARRDDYAPLEGNPPDEAIR
jgi:hypothetical protein